MDTLIGLIAGLVIGGLLFYFLLRKKAKPPVVTQSSITVLEKVEKVFKVVLAEGYFSDIFDYKHETNLFFELWNSTKKALIIANARVLIGYDFAKMKYSIDEESRKLIIEEFPQPEVLAVDPDYKFYDAENGFFNKFKNEDYTAMVDDAKKRISERALQSDLAKIAARQMKTLLSTVDENSVWQIMYRQGASLTSIETRGLHLPEKVAQIL